MEKTCIGSRWKKWGWRELRSLFLFCYASLQQCQAHSKDDIERLESLVQDELQLPFTHGFGFQALPPFMATWRWPHPDIRHTHIYIYIHIRRNYSLTYVEREYELSRPFKREKIMKKITSDPIFVPGLLIGAVITIWAVGYNGDSTSFTTYLMGLADIQNLNYCKHSCNCTHC
jgi:hypothetical protein